MGATVHGDINWGLAAETGLYADSVDFDITSDSEFYGDQDGDDVVGAHFNEKASFSLKGVARASETLAAKVGAALVLANALNWSDYITGYTSGGLNTIDSIKPSKGNRSAEMLDVSGAFRPWVVAA